MSVKSTKKQHLAKNAPRKHAPSNPRAGNNRATSRHGSATKMPTGAGKPPPKPPQNGYFIWGRHAVEAALANPERRICAIYCAGDGTDWVSGIIAGLPSDRRNSLPDSQGIDRHRLDALGGATEKAVHQGVAAAVWPLDPPHLEDFLATKCDGALRLVLLDQLSDPRNVGAIMRSARAFDVSAMITTYRNAAEENGVLARTASGALDHMPLIRVVNLARAIETLQQNDILVAGLAGEGSVPVAALSAHHRLAIVLGAEGAGLRRLSRDHCDLLVAIDINRDANSLNVSNAAAIALYAASLGTN